MVKVLIVGRTKMGTSPYRCIGGLTETGRSIRLLDRNGHHWNASTVFQVGQVWDLEFHDVDPGSLNPPHVEDVLVMSGAYVEIAADPCSAILSLVAPWRGSERALFDGHVKYTNSHNGYIADDGMPDRSTWFWIPDRDLHLRDDGKHYDYRSKLFSIEIAHGLSYVGEPNPPDVIRAGTLVRVSLAKWWKPPDADESFPKRCFVQLSGWF